MPHLNFKKIILGLVVMIFVLPFSFAQGQAIDGSTEQQPMLFQVTPQNPGPNTNINLSVTSYLTDLNVAQISWYVNGKKESSGTGMRTFSTNTGSAGNSTTVRVVVSTYEGDTIDQSKTFKPGAVDLVWESDSYTPPFYQGKAMPGMESQIRVVAIPQFGNSTAKNYVFTWKKNGQIDNSQSGFGKNSYIFTTSSLGNSSTISVSITSEDKSQGAQNSITIRPNKIKLIVYPYEQAYGTLYNNAVSGNLNLNAMEMSFSAVPYFAPTGSTPQYSWSMNNNVLPNETGSILTLRNDTGIKGQSAVSVVVTAGRNQSNTQNFSVTY